MAIQLRARGMAAGTPGRVLARATRVAVADAARGDYFRVVPRGATPQRRASR